MALRSVVVEAPASPPAPRRTVVVRTGAPAPKGRKLDILVGILGALLLVGAIGLAELLPEKTYINPEFRLTFEQVSLEATKSCTPEFVEGILEVFDCPLEVAVDNVQSMSLVMGFRDDVSLSLPDRFEVELFAPNKTQVGTTAPLQNDDPKPGAQPQDPPIVHLVDVVRPYATGPSYSQEIVTGLSPTETPEQVLARLAPDYHIATKGTWIIRITLIAAQDCPTPDQEGYPGQALHCRFGHPSGEGAPSSDPTTGNDLGNRFTLTNVLYTYFIPTITELE